MRGDFPGLYATEIQLAWSVLACSSNFEDTPLGGEKSHITNVLSGYSLQMSVIFAIEH